MRILKNVPKGVLFLFADNKWVIKNLQSEAEKRGVSKARLIFAGHISRSEYLARYKVVDLFLDTFPYNAGTTASDALWTGLPVLTCFGESFTSRMAASLLTALDLTELITSSLEQYERIAVHLALNPLKLNALREKLNHKKNTSILFYSAKMTKKIEQAYSTAYEYVVSGFPADHIYISS
jgi:predicted O-linked N-acetylglucosamine transferase (SPINDLY family)